jgi:flagellar hook-basal body complex protein FliE
MSDLSIAQVLAQIRTLSSQATPAFRPGALNSLGAPNVPGAGLADDVAALSGTGATGAPGAAQGPNFATLLKQGVDAVNSTQQRADRLETAWERGDPGVNLASVMVEAEKASVSFQALAQVRNRLISVYQDIMNMAI